MEFADGVAGLGIGRGSDGAGVEDDDVGERRSGGGGAAAVEELALWTKFGLRPANVNTGTFFVDKNNISEVLNLIKEGKG